MTALTTLVAEIFAIFGTTLTIVFSLVWAILWIIAQFRLFEMGGENGIWSIIPVVNLYKWSKIVYGSGWWFILGLIPYVNAIYGIVTTWHTGTVYGKGTLFKMGLIFLNPIFMMILAFGNTQYYGPNRRTI